MYLPCVVPDHSRPDYLATVDVDPTSATYSQVCVHWLQPQQEASWAGTCENDISFPSLPGHLGPNSQLPLTHLRAPPSAQPCVAKEPAPTGKQTLPAVLQLVRCAKRRSSTACRCRTWATSCTTAAGMRAARVTGMRTPLATSWCCRRWAPGECTVRPLLRSARCSDGPMDVHCGRGRKGVPVTCWDDFLT